MAWLGKSDFVKSERMIYNKDEDKWLRDWEINGTRRPFPPLYEAVKAYGERIYYDCPNYVELKHCKWCGKPLTGRRISFCCDECSRWFANCTIWNRGRDPYSLRILYRDNFTCQHCGEFHAMKNEHGIYIPIDDGNLNVHHIKPVSEGGGDEPEDRNIMLSDILESGVTDKDKAYCLKHQARNARDYFKKHHTQVVYEPVIIQNAHGFNKGGVKQGKTPTLTANGKWIYNNPVAIPCGTGKADKARTLTAGHQMSSHRDFVADITSSGQLGHTGVIERVFPLNTTKDGKAQTIKAQYKFTSVQNICCYNSTYGASGVAMPAMEQDKEKRKNAKNAIEKVHEVKNGYITIKEKQYAVNLPDGFYIIRKLTVAECCRLQTLPDDYCRAVSDSQAYKGLGNGWTAEVIIHILSNALKNIPKDEEIIVLSMYDGIGTGRYCLDKMGFTNIVYHAYEIDKYAMKIALSNYPDIIQHGDAFQVRANDWGIK